MKIQEEEHEITVELEEGMTLNLTIPKHLNMISLEALLKRLSKISKASGVADVEGMLRRPYKKRGEHGFTGFDSEEDAKKALQRIDKKEVTIRALGDELGVTYTTMWSRINNAKKLLNKK